MDGDEEVEFQAGGEACAVCLALDGTNTSSQPHENCLCQIVPKSSDCESSIDFNGHYYGPGLYDGGAGGEITVVCPDGSTISESFDVDFTPFNGSGRSTMDIANDGFDAEADSLCSECPEKEPFLCC